MTLRIAAVLLCGPAVLAVGCAVRTPSVQSRCAAQANDDPAVRELIMKGLGSPFFQENSQVALRQARRAAAMDCLRRQGVLPTQPGGVQGLARPRDTLFQ